MITACNNSDVLYENEEGSVTEETVQESISVTIVSDDKTITVEGTTDKSVSQILKDANVSLSSDEILSVDSDQALTDGMTIRVLKQRTINIVIRAENPEEEADTRYTAVIYGNTVDDAIKALGIDLISSCTTA